MVGVDPEMGSSVLRLWIAAGSAALLVAVCVLALARPRASLLSAVAHTAVVALAAILGAAMTWAFLDRAAVRDHDADRGALEMRAEELTARSLAPGSSLACLDALAGDSVEAACEKALFASPATVAIATSYVAARLALVSDMVAYVRHGGADIDSALLPLRHSLETDPFGFLAHALVVRDGCTSQSCQAIEVLHDSSRVRANLSAATLDRYLQHYLTVWAQSPDGPVAETTDGQPTATSQLAAQGPRKVLVNIDFPTAASIPPVSIMNPEPTGKVLPGVAAAAAANPNPPAAVATSAAPQARRSHKQAANPPAQAATPSPPPSPSGAQAQVDPVWTPAPPAAAPQADFVSGGAAPVQLNPSSSPQ